MYLNTKIRGISIPFHINFEEVNLRFYVRYKDGRTWKRGRVFIKEIVPRAAITFVAIPCTAAACIGAAGRRF